MIDGMDEASIMGLLALLGLMFGSFAGAQVWRLRSRQLNEDMRDGEVVDPTEYKTLRPLAQSSPLSDRSRCLRCGHTLAWYDLLPLVSWLGLWGRCRYCKAPIGVFEPLMEVGVAGMFVVSYLLWPAPLQTPLELLSFAVWLAAVVMLAILFAYDLKWFLLPDLVVFPLITAGVAMSTIRVMTADFALPALLAIGGAVLVLSGLYYLLWLFSGGQWVGFGDVKLGLGLALLLADWQLALVALFGANLIGTLLVIPGILSGKLGRKSHVPFGPLLIAGAVLAMLVGERAIVTYTGALF